MIDEPVAKASENSTKPNSAVAHRVRSAASRERCMPVMAAAARNSTMIVAVAHRVEAVGADGGEAEIAGERLAVDREGGARRAPPRPSGSTSARARPCPEALAIALEHEHVGEQMVREDHRLGALQVRVAGHRRLDVLLGALDRGPGARRRPSTTGATTVSQVEPLVEGDLIVPRASRVELAADGPASSVETALDVRVDVLELRPETEAPGLDLVPHGRESVGDRSAARPR